MKQATEVYSREFDRIFLSLPPRVQTQLLSGIREMGRRLESFPHCRLQGRTEFRLRVGDYRIVYEFDARLNELYLVTLGHRRDVYRRM